MVTKERACAVTVSSPMVGAALSLVIGAGAVQVLLADLLTFPPFTRPKRQAPHVACRAWLV